MPLLRPIDQNGPFDPDWIECPSNRQEAVEFGELLLDDIMLINEEFEMPSPAAQVLGVLLLFLSSCHVAGIDPEAAVKQIALPHACGYFRPQTVN